MAVFLTRRRRKGAAGGDAELVRRAVEATLELEGASGREVSVLLTDDREIHVLNRDYRHKDAPTDVLAFAYDEVDAGEGVSPVGPAEVLMPLGDVIISVERAEKQAVSRRVALASELELLAVHGTLHLLGYDHAEPAEAKRMRAKTRTVRGRLARSR